MTGDIGDLAFQREAARFQRPDRGQRHRHQRRLRVGGQRQRLFRPFPDQLRQVFAERIVDFLEDPARFGEGAGEILAHADRLAALSGKGECNGHARAPKGWFCLPEDGFFLPVTHGGAPSQARFDPARGQPRPPSACCERVFGDHS
jgi:hypothetical protein